MEIKVMVVPGKIARVEVFDGGTVIDACAGATAQHPGIDWAGLAKDREVRVQNRKFSNTDEVADGYFGTIAGTPLNDGEVILILTKIKGNSDGLGVLTCCINGQEYALETPEEVGKVLRNVAGIDLDEVESIFVNGDEAHLSQLVGSGDDVNIVFYSDLEEEYPPDEDFTLTDQELEDDEAETVTVTVDGHTVSGRPADLRKIFCASR